MAITKISGDICKTTLNDYQQYLLFLSLKNHYPRLGLTAGDYSAWRRTLPTPLKEDVPLTDVIFYFTQITHPAFIDLDKALKIIERTYPAPRVTAQPANQAPQPAPALQAQVAAVQDEVMEATQDARSSSEKSLSTTATVVPRVSP